MAVDYDKDVLKNCAVVIHLEIKISNTSRIFFKFELSVKTQKSVSFPIVYLL